MKKFIAFILIVLSAMPSVSLALGSDYEYVIAPQFKTAMSFTRFSIAKVTLSDGQNAVINAEGKIVLSSEKPLAIRNNGLIMAVGDNDMAAFFSSDGKQLTDYIYDTYKRVNPKLNHEVTYNYVTNSYDGEPLYNGLIPISRGKKFGYINAEGIEVIPPSYEYAEGFYKNNIARVQAGGKISEYGTYMGGKFGYIKYSEHQEPKLQTLYPAGSLWSAEHFKGKYAEIADGELKTLDSSGKVVNLSGKNYRYGGENGDLIRVSNEKGETSVLNAITDKLVVPFDYTQKKLELGHVITEFNQIIDKNGNIIYEAPEDMRIGSSHNWTIYSDYLYNFDEPQFFSVYKVLGDWVYRYGLVNTEGEVVFEPIYQGKLTQLADGLVYIEGDNGENAIYNKFGKRLFAIDGGMNYYSNISCGLLPVCDRGTGKWGYIGYPFKQRGKAAADFLYNIGLFKGKSINSDGSPNYELNYHASREESLVMLIRLLGKEDEAVNHPKTHPFIDVSEWADGYVSYAYENDITNGISDTVFGNHNYVTSAEFLTFMLRALGYSDKDGDFDWADPYIFASSNGLQNGGINQYFDRAVMTDIAYHSLYAKLKNSDKYLWQVLEEEGAIPEGSVPTEKAPLPNYNEAIE